MISWQRLNYIDVAAAVQLSVIVRWHFSIWNVKKMDTLKFDVITFYCNLHILVVKRIVQFSWKCKSRTSAIKRSSINVRTERHLIFVIFRVIKNRPKTYQRTFSLLFFLHRNDSWFFPPLFYLKLRLCQVCPLLLERWPLSPNQFGFHDESKPNESRLKIFFSFFFNFLS